MNKIIELNTLSFDKENEFFSPSNTLWEVLLLENLFLRNPIDTIAFCNWNISEMIRIHLLSA